MRIHIGLSVIRLFGRSDGRRGRGRWARRWSRRRTRRCLRPGSDGCPRGRLRRRARTWSGARANDTGGTAGSSTGGFAARFVDRGGFGGKFGSWLALGNRFRERCFFTRQISSRRIFERIKLLRLRGQGHHHEGQEECYGEPKPQKVTLRRCGARYTERVVRSTGRRHAKPCLCGNRIQQSSGSFRQKTAGVLYRTLPRCARRDSDTLSLSHALPVSFPKTMLRGRIEKKRQDAQKTSNFSAPLSPYISDETSRPGRCRR